MAVVLMAARLFAAALLAAIVSAEIESQHPVEYFKAEALATQTKAEHTGS